MLKHLFKPDDSHQFKPILVEIEEEPTSPLRRAVFWLVLLTFSFFLCWAIWGQMDIVISARGRVVPVGDMKLLQPLATGVIRQIYVKEGDFVHKGQVLIVIDPATTESELKSYQTNLQHLILAQARLNAEKEGRLFQVGNGSNTQQALYIAANQKLTSQIESKQKEIESLAAQMQQKSVEASHSTTDLQTQREQKDRLSSVKDLIPHDDYQKVTDKILEDESKLKRLEYEHAELEAKKQQALEEIAVLKNAFRTDNLNNLSDTETKITELKANVQKMTFQNAQQKILSPVDGYVQDLYVHTVGGVVSPAENLVSIVPIKTPLKIQAMVPNKDIGYVKKGLPVTLKIDTFDFQKYGTLKGVVARIPKTSTEINSTPTKAENASNSPHVSSDNPSGESFYMVDITPLDRSMMVDGHPEFLTTGLSLTSEIKVGKRHIIEFFIYPLIKHWNEGLSVR